LTGRTSYVKLRAKIGTGVPIGGQLGERRLDRGFTLFEAPQCRCRPSDASPDNGRGRAGTDRSGDTPTQTTRGLPDRGRDRATGKAAYATHTVNRLRSGFEYGRRAMNPSSLTGKHRDVSAEAREKVKKDT
jgi:hypothetical protein